MMNRIVPFLTLLLSLTACKKEEERYHSPAWEDGMHTSADIRHFLDKIAPGTQVFNIAPAVTGTYATRGGAHITVYGYSVRDKDSNIILQPVIRLAVKEYFTKADLLTGNVSTVTSDKLLNTAGV